MALLAILLLALLFLSQRFFSLLGSPIPDNDKNLSYRIYDVSLVCRAIGTAETGSCQNSVDAQAAKNCVGIMTWETGERTLKKYETIQQSYEDCERIWTAYYGVLPRLSEAKKWTGGDQSEAWLRHFYEKYDSLL